MPTHLEIFLCGGLISFFGKKIMIWIFCGGGFYLDKMSFRWNHFRVPCLHVVDWISFICVLMDRFHGIYKDQHDDGYPVDLRFWSPDITHHMLLLLQVMRSYFFAVTTSNSTAFIFYPGFGMGEVTYHCNLMVKVWEWGCTPLEYLGSQIFKCV